MNAGGTKLPSEQAAASRAPRALRVLVADDDRDLALTLSLLLRDEGHEVRAVSSGAQTVRAVADFDPDVVLLDIALPEMNGWEVARRIRARYGSRRPMLIAISGEYKDGADRILAQISGFEHYLTKPCDPNALLALLAPLSAI